MTFPQAGGCLCGDLRFELSENPISVYACHCTDCQKETGSAFVVSATVRSEAFEWTTGAPETWHVTLPDGRIKGSEYCPRCTSKLGGQSRFEGVRSVDTGAFDDTSWLTPPVHIWTRSAQPWIRFPEGALLYDQSPPDEDLGAIIRAWRHP
ncbi:MAG: GFA family protein [Myxococcota bacterium]|nr:GFA family protein [Myxococcota bacterium]